MTVPFINDDFAFVGIKIAFKVGNCKFQQISSFFYTEACGIKGKFSAFCVYVSGHDDFVIIGGDWFCTDESKIKCKAFRERFVYMDDGKATERVVKRVINEKERV